MQKRSKILIIILCLIMSVSSSGLIWAASDNVEQGGNLITKIDIKGNQQISDEKILSVVKTKVGEQISNERLQKDLQAIFDLGYFFDVQVSFENYKSGVKLIFEVVENPTLKKIEFKGNRAVSDQKLKEILKVEIGKMLNTNNLNESLRKIESYYQDEGYILAKVEDILVEKDGTLSITIDEGKLAEIKIKGNEKTKPFVIKRKLSMEEGDVFNVKKMRQDLRQVYNLGFFKDIKPKLEKGSKGKNKVVLIIKIEERKTGNFGLGAGYSSTDGWIGHFEVEEKNLMGRAQKLSFRWEFGEKETYELSFFEPWAFGSDTSVGFSIYDRTEEQTGQFADNSEVKYEKQEKGGSITLGHPLGFETEGYLKYEYKNTFLDSLDSQYEIPETEQESSTRSLNLSAVRDTRNDVFNPTDGRKDKLSVKYAGQALGGDNDFTKYQLDLRDYTPDFMFENNSWAFRVKTGLSEGNLPEPEKYRIGGAQTLRGFKDGEFIGDSMAVLNAEYRIPIADKFDGVLFADLGENWNKKEDESFKYDNLNKSVGAGVRVKTPVGQLRLDYGFQIDRQDDKKKDSRLHFSLGQSF